MVHSAQWTPAMLKQFGCDVTDKKGDFVNLVRICGFGVPYITRALESFRNDYTMIIEDMIYPYKHEKNKSAKNKGKLTTGVSLQWKKNYSVQHWD